jgi:hypothetical protein
VPRTHKPRGRADFQRQVAATTNQAEAEGLVAEVLGSVADERVRSWLAKVLGASAPKAPSAKRKGRGGGGRVPRD